jgi:drug/metabolite transporter (DMT)-like permease
LSVLVRQVPRPATPGFWPAVLALMLNALVWGVSWWPFRQLQARGLHPLWTTVLVYTLAVAVILLWRPAALRQLRQTRALWTLMLAAGLTNAAFNWAVSIGEVVRVVLLFYVSPLWTALLARWLLHEPLHAGVLVRVGLALAGVWLVLSDAAPSAWASGADLRLADLLGLLAGATFALNNVLLRRQAAQPGAARALAMFGGSVLVSALLAVIGGAAGRIPAAAPAALPGLLAQPGLAELLLLLALVFLVGNLALQFGATRLPANVTAVVMPVEIVFATVSSVWLAGEALRGAVLLGGALILGATWLAARDSSHVSIKQRGP